jgi:hypothetical protein
MGMIEKGARSWCKGAGMRDYERKGDKCAMGGSSGRDVDGGKAVEVVKIEGDETRRVEDGKERKIQG